MGLLLKQNRSLIRCFEKKKMMVKHIEFLNSPHNKGYMPTKINMEINYKTLKRP